jgi:uncharacterized RDD family membrane protein YckC
MSLSRIEPGFESPWERQFLKLDFCPVIRRLDMTLAAYPAPLWRRLAAAVYDVLLLLGLWLSATFIAWLIAHLFGKGTLPPAFMRAYLFVITFGFFGWFWTHGGQTLGMRAWRLQLRRADGGPLHWANAMLRFAVAIPSWLLIAGVLWCLVDGQRRSWHDLLAGTEVVVLPKTGS